MRIFPRQLQDRSQWLPARLTDYIDSEGRPAKKKVGVDHRNGENAPYTDPACWMSFHDAEAYRVKHDLPYLGFVLAEGDNISVLDVDRHEGDPDPEGRDRLIGNVIKRVMGKTYIEQSQSGNGLHVVCLGTLDPAYKKRRAPFELYDRKRFMVMTGNAVGGMHHATEQPEFLSKMQEWIGRKPDIVQGNGDQVPVHTDLELVRLCRASCRYWDWLLSGRYDLISRDKSKTDFYFFLVVFQAGGTDKQAYDLFASNLIGQRMKGSLRRYEDARYLWSETIPNARAYAPFKFPPDEQGAQHD